MASKLFTDFKIVSKYTIRKGYQMTKKFFSLLITLTMIAGMLVLPASAETSITPFENGDRVMFLGDSITLYGTHIQYIEEAHAFHYPQKDVEFINSALFRVCCKELHCTFTGAITFTCMILRSCIFYHPTAGCWLKNIIFFAA